MFKKISLGFAALSLVVLIGFGVVNPSVARAGSLSSMNLLRSVNVLGISVLQTGSTKLYVSDMSGETSSRTITLPTLTGNGGLIYTVKQTGSSSYSTAIVPVSGQKIENITDATVGIANSGDFITLAADENAGTWWVIGVGNYSM